MLKDLFLSLMRYVPFCCFYPILIGVMFWQTERIRGSKKRVAKRAR